MVSDSGSQSKAAYALSARNPNSRFQQASQTHSGGRSKALIMGNWKCHKSLREASQFLRQWQRYRIPLDVEVTLFPTFLALPGMEQQRQSQRLEIKLGAQNVSAAELGAHTGEIAASMLQELGTHSVLIGHSERRANQGEKGVELAAKMQRSLEAGLRPVFCFGETLEERRQNRTNDVLVQQLREGLSELSQENFVVAYEPVWAIGTGVVPEMSQLAQTAADIREILKYLGFSESLPLLYGGSVKRSNAAQIMQIDGFNGLLIGGASLDPEHLFDIVRQSCKSSQTRV